VFENKRLEIVKGLGVVENENLDIIDVKFFFMKDQVKDCVKLNIIFALSEINDAFHIFVFTNLTLSS